MELVQIALSVESLDIFDGSSSLIPVDPSFSTHSACSLPVSGLEQASLYLTHLVRCSIPLSTASDFPRRKLYPSPENTLLDQI
jgi:hypothetical protein